ncbi:hypothetical protein ACFSC3_19190 [Sphingomonas floccifaciens]|uniref:Helix-turn-helix domain-containing protein n=1 Tax=Sphingomonas floccifaciens TaxID=1844115 RepID=A0ABW4NJI9_9SPHN
MSAFRPLTPKEAIELVEAAEVGDAARLIQDFAAAGVVKSYAMVRETIEPGGGRRIVRDGALPKDDWERIVRDGVAGDVWSGGTVRLEGGELIGSEPLVMVTGVSFNPGDLKKLIDRFLGQRKPATPARRPAENACATSLQAPSKPVETVRGRRPDLSVLNTDALLMTIADAGRTLGFGRTKINGLMKSGRLERKEIDGGVRITVASVRALAGFTS